MSTIGDADSSGVQPLEPPRKSRRRAGAVVLLYAALTCLFAYPLPLHLGTHLLATGTDPELWMWTLAWDSHAFVHQPFALFDANIFYPVHYSLGYSENLIGSAMLGAPMLWITGNPVLTMNVLELLSATLCALGAYVLARRIGLRPGSAVLAGLVFGFAPARFLRITQFHLTTVQWVPFALAFLHAYLHGGRKADLRWFVAFASLQALTSGHGAVFLVVAAVLFVGYRLAQGEPLALRKRVSDLGVVGALLLVPAIWLYWSYHMARTEVPELSRVLDDFGSSTASYFASPTHLQTFVLAHAPAWFTTTEPDAFLFPGYLPVLLAVVALALGGTRGARQGSAAANRWWRRAAVLLEVVIVGLTGLGVFLVVSHETRIRLGNTPLFTVRHPWRLWALVATALVVRLAVTSRAPLDIFGRLRRLARASGQWWWARRRDIAMFYALLTAVCVWLTLGPPIGLWRWVYWLPAMNFIRVPSRFVILEMLGLAVLSGLGFERATARLTPAWRAGAALVVGAALVGEFAAMPLRIDPFRVEIPAVDRWLNDRPKPFAIAEVPMPRSPSVAVFAQFNARYMLHAMAHWQKTVHGYSGVEPALHTTLYRQLTHFPDDASVRSLVDLGVTYVVMHLDQYRGHELAEVEQRLPAYKDWLTLEHVDGDGRVYSIHAPK